MYTAQGRARDAARAVLAHPDDVRPKEAFIQVAGGTAVIAFDETIDQAVVECLKAAETLDCAKMLVLWTTHLFSTPAFHAAYGLRDKENFAAANKGAFEQLSDLRPLVSPCFLLGIRSIVSDQPRFEEFITHVRRRLLLDDGVGTRLTREETVTLAAALAHYAFNTEYILDCTEEERRKVDAIRGAIERGTPSASDAAAVAIVASYTPLHELRNAADIARALAAAPELADVVKTQIVDHDARRRIASSIVALTPIEDTVSAKVREQYEEFPYRCIRAATSPTMDIDAFRAAAESRRHERVAHRARSLPRRAVDLARHSGCRARRHPRRSPRRAQGVRLRRGARRGSAVRARCPGAHGRGAAGGGL